MAAPPDPCTSEPTPSTSDGPRRDGRVLTALVWTALVLAPLLYLIELSGPRWLNLALRGVWVAVVAVVGALLVRDRVRSRRAGDGALA